MELIKHDLNVDFVGKIKVAVILSWVVILIGLGSMVVKGGLNYGVDFSGGILVQVKFAQATNAADIKQALKELDLGGATVQAFGDDAQEFMIRAQTSSSELSSLSDAVKESLEKSYGANSVDVRRAEMVGPQVGKDLRQKGMLAVLYAMIGTLIYIAWRFELQFAIGAILALLHDVLITLGAFSLFNKEIDLPIIAAFLAIIGYSLNDTIIIYDRIRENRGRYSKESFAVIVNRSVNETMSRTIMTTGTTLLVVIALFIFGGGVIHNFAFALLIGINVGTYSTIFVASAFVLAWDKWQAGRSGGLTPAKGKTA
jgi:preprotein translocase subunit SecF